jgi:hypothetical protein
LMLRRYPARQARARGVRARPASALSFGVRAGVACGARAAQRERARRSAARPPPPRQHNVAAARHATLARLVRARMSVFGAPNERAAHGAQGAAVYAPPRGARRCRSAAACGRAATPHASSVNRETIKSVRGMRAVRGARAGRPIQQPPARGAQLSVTTRAAPGANAAARGQGRFDPKGERARAKWAPTCSSVDGRACADSSAGTSHAALPAAARRHSQRV